MSRGSASAAQMGCGASAMPVASQPAIEARASYLDAKTGCLKPKKQPVFLRIATRFHLQDDVHSPLWRRQFAEGNFHTVHRACLSYCDEQTKLVDKDYVVKVRYRPNTYKRYQT